MKKFISIILCAITAFSCAGISANAYTYYYSYIIQPSYVSVYNSTDTSLEIYWGYSSNASGYLLYCKKQGGKFKKLKTFKSNSKTSYVHKKLAYGKKYTYKVKAYGTISGKKKYSAYSPVAGKKVVEPLTVDYPALYSVTALDTDTFKINWQSLYRASGYELYYKTSGTEFKKLATLNGKNKTTYTHKNLTAGKKYFYKVRAYRNTSSSKKYSKYSGQLGKKCTNYLVDLYSPYQYDNYKEYKNGEAFLMGGEKYGNGFTLKWLSSGYAVYNLKGKYHYIDITIGNLDGSTQPSTINILSDNKSIGTFNVESNALPKKIRFNIEYANKLEIKRSSDSFGSVCGLAEIKLYK